MDEMALEGGTTTLLSSLSRILAFDIVGHELCDVIPKSRPVQILREPSYHLRDPHMPSCACCMIFNKERRNYWEVLRQPNATFLQNKVLSNGEVRV